MKLSYFSDTDTLYLKLNDEVVMETRDFDDNTVVDCDADGNIVGITMEHASTRTDISTVNLSGIVS